VTLILKLKIHWTVPDYKLKYVKGVGNK